MNFHILAKKNFGPGVNKHSARGTRPRRRREGGLAGEGEGEGERARAPKGVKQRREGKATRRLEYVQYFAGESGRKSTRKPRIESSSVPPPNHGGTEAELPRRSWWCLRFDSVVVESHARRERDPPRRPRGGRRREDNSAAGGSGSPFPLIRKGGGGGSGGWRGRVEKKQERGGNRITGISQAQPLCCFVDVLSREM